MPAAKAKSRPRSADQHGQRTASAASPAAQTMEGAILRALAMTGRPATASASTPKPRPVAKPQARRAVVPPGEHRVDVTQVREDIATYDLVASDIVRFRPKGAIDRRIKVEYMADPRHTESVLLRLTPASAADLPGKTVEEDLLSSQEAADLLGVSRPYLTKLVDQGAFQGVMRTAAGHRRVPRAELERVRAEMQGARRAALEKMEEITRDLRARELELARANPKRRWVPKST